MKEALEFECEQHVDRFECPDALISYYDRFDEYGLIVHDGGHSVIRISYCPWCGMELPESKRERWFNELKALGYDDPVNQDIPAQYRSNRWYH
jgi:hypothetical protein